jgi:hypothetical protein
MRAKHGPEFTIQKNLIAFLSARGWLVERMVGNAFQSGIPDLYCYHPKWGERWIDAKVEGHYSFTKAQRIKWPRWESFGVGIWILTAADQEEYNKLFAPPNWRDYWKPCWELPTQAELTSMLDEIT